MRSLPLLLALLPAVALTPRAWTQIPYGEAISNAPPRAPVTEGLIRVNRNGSCAAIKGLFNTPRSDFVNGVALDPIDQRVWIGGIGRVDTVEITPTDTITNLTLIANTQSGRVEGFTFDDNCNPVLATGNIRGTGIVRLDRASGASTRIAGGTSWPFQDGVPEGICRDPDGNLYFGVNSPGNVTAVFRLTKNPVDGSYGAPVSLGPVRQPSKVTFAPAVGTRAARLYYMAVGGDIGWFPPTGGTPVFVRSSLGYSIDYDSRRDDFWVIFSGPQMHRMDHGGGSSAICSYGASGFATSSDANDWPFHETRVCPQYLPAAPTAFTLELSMSCPPGSDAGILILSPFPVLLTLGVAGADGKVFVKIPNVVFQAGSPGIVAFVSASYDRTRGALTVGPTKTWPLN